ncbi:MAG: RNA polymerase sigma factor [Anaerolineae bacterium]
MDRLDPKRERELVEKAMRDPQAFGELYNHYFPRIYAYVSYRVGRVQDTEDLVSEVFLKAVSELTRFKYRGERSFSAWLYRIAHNAVSDLFRQRKRRQEPINLDELPEMQAHTILPDDALLRKENFRRLRRLIKTLSPSKQEAITLKFFGGLRNKEIAAVLGISEKTVASNLCRGLEELHRKFLADSE